MDDIIRLLMLMIIGGFIGYITNKLAIKMLFRPVNPKKILFITIQGVFPKRKDKMAKSLAEIIERELLSKEVIMSKILNDEKIDSFKKIIAETLIKKIPDVIPPMMRMFINDEIIINLIDKHGDAVIDDLINNLRTQGLEDLDIFQIVKDRIDELDFIEFEKIIFGLMASELRFVEIIGLVLGAIIGVVQFFVTQIPL